VRNGLVRFGAAFEMPAPPNSNRLVTFFRPEDVNVLSDNGGQPAVVESKLFLGSLTRVYLAVETEDDVATLYADLPSRSAMKLEPGSQVTVSIDPSHVTAFPADG
jgi:putative spermidine/putrescine transport system ATP-binding protein